MFTFLKKGFSKLRDAFRKTRALIGDKVASLFGKPMDEATFEELERILYEADLGSECAIEFAEATRRFVRKEGSPSPKAVIDFLKEKALTLLSKKPEVLPKTGTPHMILMVGVNGSGKTTSTAKLAKKYVKQGKKVLLAAGDTFRAAAIEQLAIWSERVGVDIVKGTPGGDPSAVIFDALTKAKTKGYDVVIADTAGRLQSKTDLMHELGKIDRVVKKVVPDAPHEVLLVLDATTGQNAIDQAKIFNEFTPLTGLVLTKLDGSAKGGIILSIYHQMGIPVQFIGIGEKEEDLIPFNKEEYVDSLF